MRPSQEMNSSGVPANRRAVPAASRQGRTLMEDHGLRATRQRIGLAKLLFGNGDRHVTADTLSAEAAEAKMPASLATVYNVLNLFAEVGLVRALPIEGTKTVFDTNTSDHGHFYFEDTGEIDDIRASSAKLATAVEPPEGFEIVRIDIVVRLRRKTSLADQVKDPVER